MQFRVGIVELDILTVFHKVAIEVDIILVNSAKMSKTVRIQRMHQQEGCIGR